MTLLKELYEAVEPLPQDMDLEAQLTELEKRMSAAKRGLHFAHRLKNPIQKKKHFKQMITNMNHIRGALSRAVKQMEQFANAASDYESKFGHYEQEEDVNDEEFTKRQVLPKSAAVAPAPTYSGEEDMHSRRMVLPKSMGVRKP